MAQIFTSNQVNHVYVATSLAADNAKVTKADNVGTISVQHDVEGNLYFMHKGYGGVTRSDLITNIMDVRYTPAIKMFRKQNAALITLNTGALDSNSKAFLGQDYLLRLEFQNPVGMSPDHKYWKYGVVHATTNMTASQFYAKMAKSLAVNMSREAVKLVNIFLVEDNVSYVNTSGKLTPVEASTDLASLDDTYVGIKLVEASQEWVLGVKQDKPIIFRINNSTISNGTADVYWADVVYKNGQKMTGGLEVDYTTVASNLPEGDTIRNSRLAAELEYFAMGERADLYRNVGWPDVINTKYIADPTNAYGYDMINIHYAYVGSNHAVQKSEKDITILVPRTANDEDSDNEINVIGALTASIKSYIEAVINPADSRYVPATIFNGDSYTDGNLAALKVDTDGKVTGIIDSTKDIEDFEPAQP